MLPGVRIPHFPQKKKRVLLHKECSFLFEKAGPSLTTVGGSYLGESLERYALIIALTNPSLSAKKEKKLYTWTLNISLPSRAEILINLFSTL